MQKNLLIIATLLMAGPLTFAHTNGGTYGTPKTYCEYHVGDMNVHDYAHGSTTPYFIIGPIDGNVEPCAAGESDGHGEFAIGGAVLLASEGTTPGSGATTCFGYQPDHSPYPDVWVFDHTWPSGVLFMVAADMTSFPQPDPTGGQIDCGDGIPEVNTGYCIDHCSVSFPPGTDGAYYVFVVNELFEDGLFDGPTVDIHHSDQTGVDGHMACFQDPTDPALWICVHDNRNPQDPNPRFSTLGHVYT